MNLPTGTVTFLFSDIVGSTRLLQDLGAGYHAVLDDHNSIMRRAFQAHNGREVGTEGDSFFVAFERASDAVNAAVDAQLGINGHDWPANGTVSVRIGLHTGEAYALADDYVGLSVHVASRVMSITHGGQIVVTGTTQAITADGLPDPVSYSALGRHPLKGLDQDWDLYQVNHPHLSAEFPALNTRRLTRTNLRPSLTNFVGRRDEVRAISDLVATRRLVTITGPGGMGKTRISQEIGRELAARFPDGVWMVDLSVVTDPQLVPAAVAAGIGQPHLSGMPDVCDSLRDASVLLLLDNCEHLLEPSASTAAALIQGTDDTHLLATSRIPLGITGEITFPLDSLETSAEPGSDAVALFADRAASHDPTFKLDDTNVEHVIEVCERLDGLPLAIELAAALARTLSPKQIAERLDERFDLLTKGPRDSSSRHQTLLAAIAWGFNLLTPDQQYLLRRLCVFNASFTLEAAEHVCSGPELGSQRIYHVIDDLVDRSLVKRKTEPSGPRYAILESIRHFGVSQMEASRAEAPTAGGPRTGQYIFKNVGDHYLVGGPDRTHTLKSSVGLKHLSRLVAAPETPIASTELTGSGLIQGGLGTDRESLRAYRERLASLEIEIGEARANNDLGATEKLQNELEAVTRELTRSGALGGRTRSQSGTTERARMSVTKAIRTAISRILEVDPELGRHLDRSVTTGHDCVYSPAEPVSWELS